LPAAILPVALRSAAEGSRPLTGDRLPDWRVQVAISGDAAITGYGLNLAVRTARACKNRPDEAEDD
jgi:hypothetical protein